MARDYYNSSYYNYLQYFSLPLPVLFFVAIVFILIFTWYISHESMFEDFMDNFKICLMVFPVVLLLIVHWLSSEDRESGAPFLSLPEKDSLHRVGGSPLGVGILLLFLIFMISHHSSMQEKWFPFFSRR